MVSSPIFLEIYYDLDPVNRRGFLFPRKLIMDRKSTNLKPCKTTQEARERGRLGGIASGKAKRKKKSLREALEILLSMPLPSADGKKTETLEAISAALIRRALAGDVKAFEVIRDTIGQKPVEKIEQTNLEPRKFIFEIVKSKNHARE